MKVNQQKENYAVEMLTDEGQHVANFKNIREASEKTWCPLSAIHRCCYGRQETTNGYRFRFKTMVKKVKITVVFEGTVPEDVTEEQMRERVKENVDNWFWTSEWDDDTEADTIAERKEIKIEFPNQSSLIHQPSLASKPQTAKQPI